MLKPTTDQCGALMACYQGAVDILNESQKITKQLENLGAEQQIYNMIEDLTATISRIAALQRTL